MKNKNKLITIITSHFNDLDGLMKTWESINKQTISCWKWIIIDSFTNDFYINLPEKIYKNTNIDIYQLSCSIYDAMNFGILQVNTDYYHFLNCNSYYTSSNALEQIIKIIYSDQKSRKIYSFQLQVLSASKKIIQKPSKLFFPFQSGHESTIFPRINRDKILIKSQLGVTADLIFMIENSFKYNLECYKLDFVSYPRGGYSDNLNLNNEKINGYIYLYFILISRFKLISSLFCIKKILSEIKVKILN